VLSALKLFSFSLISTFSKFYIRVNLIELFSLAETMGQTRQRVLVQGKFCEASLLFLGEAGGKLQFAPI
jgi:hypothetical protein